MRSLADDIGRAELFCERNAVRVAAHDDDLLGAKTRRLGNHRDVLQFERQYCEARALELMDKAFNHDYPSKGMAFALGTHSRYPGSWLLVGVIRLDRVSQMTLEL